MNCKNGFFFYIKECIGTNRECAVFNTYYLNNHICSKGVCDEGDNLKGRKQEQRRFSEMLQSQEAEGVQYGEFESLPDEYHSLMRKVGHLIG